MNTIPQPSAESLFFEGTQRLSEGDADDAEQAFRDALELAPDFAEAHANLGLVLEMRGALDEAETSYRRSLELDPKYAQTHSNLDNLLAARKRFIEAEAAHQRAVELAPTSPSAWTNLGALLACLQRDDEAELCHHTACHFDPDFAKARFNLSYLLLRQGRYDEGWACHEARPWVRAPVAPAWCGEDQPQRWRGEPLHGKSLLVGYEGGHGDMIQFCRYLPLLKAGAQRASRWSATRRCVRCSRRWTASMRSTQQTATTPCTAMISGFIR
jgi:tetratricopeptide (TPR) repeat protein